MTKLNLPMKLPTIVSIVVLLVAAGTIAFVINTSKSDSTSHDSLQQESHGSEPKPLEAVKGPNGGRLLTQDDFQIEVTIFERGIPPEFRVYAYNRKALLDVSAVKLTIKLLRFGGRIDTIAFRERDGYLLGNQEVIEPHSFDVEVTANYGGQAYHWRYDSYEGRTEMSPESAQSSGVVLDSASSSRIQNTLKAYGTISPNAEKLTHITPRYSGVVKSIQKQLGDHVSKGGVLAVVQSNDSLQTYELASELEGTVIFKDVTAGEYLNSGEAIYTVADLGSVWVDLQVYRDDVPHIQLGQPVTIDGGEGIGQAQGTIDYLSPIGTDASQTMLARVVLPNPKGLWRPGLNVSGQILIEEITVPVAVHASALQKFRDWDVVFLNDGRLFEIAILELGRRDAQWVEVLSGLTSGQTYVSENSFLIKADVLKSGASHDH